MYKVTWVNAAFWRQCLASLKCISHTSKRLMCAGCSQYGEEKILRWKVRNKAFQPEAVSFFRDREETRGGKKTPHKNRFKKYTIHHGSEESYHLSSRRLLKSSIQSCSQGRSCVMVICYVSQPRRAENIEGGSVNCKTSPQHEISWVRVKLLNES